MNQAFWKENEWELVSRQTVNAMPGEWVSHEPLSISHTARQYLKKELPNGLYRHQYEALQSSAVEHQHTCMTTGTASGKTLPFMVAAIEQLAHDPASKILALYPMKALGFEQEGRWKDTLHAAKMPARVGRIDGGVATSARLRILGDNQIIVATPDVVHAWFLGNLGEPPIRKFFKQLKLVVVDEVHTYTGVFGSNAAYLFRRLHHASTLLGGGYRYIAASATMANPNEHLKKLFGVPFQVISRDTSPKEALTVDMVMPPAGDFLTQIVSLLSHMAETGERFITFVDSRKQTEQIATILARKDRRDEDLRAGTLEVLDIMPYRAGYEEHDRRRIQERLNSGDLKGVVSTSALELGLDIPGLTAAILVGVPHSATSFQQRVGRIGRHAPGHVTVIHGGGVLDDVVFRHPETLFERPLTESALYLENRRIQYIHALCLARSGGEHDQLMGTGDDDDIDLDRTIEWPDEFARMCQEERAGAIPVEFHGLKERGGDRPQLVFALRDVDIQFTVALHGQTDGGRRLGSLSHGQVLREAYPGAVYYYATTPYRVTRIDSTKRVISVRPERHYTTVPTSWPTQIYPNFSEGNVHQGRRQGDLRIVECNLQIRDAVVGYKERRGPNETIHEYPIPLKDNIFFREAQFYRYYFSSGVVLTHPLLVANHQTAEALAGLLYEGFLMTIPFERQDVGFGSGRHRKAAEGIYVHDRFIALFDQTYGSLRLSSRLMDRDILVEAFRQCQAIVNADEDNFYTEGTRQLLQVLYEESRLEPQPYLPYESDADWASPGEHAVKVLAPGSVGIAVNKGTQEVIVEDIFYHPLKHLAYRVRYANQASSNNGAASIWSVDEIVPIEGVSTFRYYNLNTGTLEDIGP